MSAQNRRDTLSPSNRAILLFSAVVLVSLGIWCFVLAVRFGLWAIAPRESLNNRMLALISLLIELTLGLLLILGGTISVYLDRIGKAGIGNLWSLLHPSFAKLVTLIILIALSVFALTERTATSKLTWQENRGVPLAFLSLTEHRGPCGPDFNFCTSRHFDALYPLQLVADGLVLYYATCVFGFAIQKVSRRLTSH